MAGLAKRVAGWQGPGSDAWAIHWAARERQDQGQAGIILLTVGDPEIASPDAVVEAAVTSLRRGHTHYADITGQPGLRIAIARQHRRTTGQDVDPDRIVVLPGAQNALFSACQAVLDPGDRILVPDPMYVTYPATIAAAGAELVRIPSPAERAFHLDLDAMEAAIERRTRAILLNSPSNPTGVVLRRDEIEAVAALCIRHDLWLISDEVYATLVWSGEHVSPAGIPGMDGRAVTVSSLSKSHAMTGWRVGWVVGPPEIAQAVESLSLCMLYGSPGFIQDAAERALEGGLPELDQMRASLSRRRQALLDRLGGVAGLHAVPPEGGMFVMLDIRATGLTAKAFAQRLLDEEGVATLPGEAFGDPAAGHLRISLTVPDTVLDEACGRIAAFARRLG